SPERGRRVRCAGRRTAATPPPCRPCRHGNSHSPANGFRCAGAPPAPADRRGTLRGSPSLLGAYSSSLSKLPKHTRLPSPPRVLLPARPLRRPCHPSHSAARNSLSLPSSPPGGPAAAPPSPTSGGHEKASP